jgi:general secretion pathway protein F
LINFQYRAYLADGRQETGNIEAADKIGALRKLASSGKSAFELHEAKTKSLASKKSKVPSQRFSFLSRRFNPAQLFADLALLTEAGLTISQALRSIHSTEPVAEQKAVVEKLLENMSAGSSAAAAFGNIRSIPQDSLGLVASGESAGRLPEVFRALTTQYDERAKLKAQFLNALGYPLFLFALMVLAVWVLTFVLVPAIEPIFENADRPPPLIVSLWSTLRGWLTGSFAVAGPLALMVLLLASLLPSLRTTLAAMFSRLVMRLPLVGSVIRKTSLARYLSSLALLLANGTSMSKALSLAATSVSLASFQQKLLSVRDRVATGERLPTALQHTGLFDDRILSLLSVGDEANRLAIVAQRASQLLNAEAQTTISRFIAFLTPAMTITLGLLVGGLVVSVMTALLSINEIAIQ